MPQIRVRVLGVDDITSYSIHDLVMPLPGYAVVYPRHEGRLHLSRIAPHFNQCHSFFSFLRFFSSFLVGDSYKAMLAQDGVDIENMRSKTKFFCIIVTFLIPLSVYLSSCLHLAHHLTHCSCTHAKGVLALGGISPPLCQASQRHLVFLPACYPSDSFSLSFLLFFPTLTDYQEHSAL